MTPYLARVRWDDAHGDANQTVYDLTDLAHEPLVVESVGYVVRKDDTGVTMFTDRVHQQDGSFSWRGRGFIPNGMIREIKRLR